MNPIYVNIRLVCCVVSKMEGISPPGQLNLRAEDLAGEWRRWVRSFNDYLCAIDLVATSKAAEKRKLALFRCVGGEDVRELYSQMEFNSAPQTLTGAVTEIEEGANGRKLDDVIKRFHEYCNPRSGAVVSRFEFHNCRQNGDTVDVFLMKLRSEEHTSELQSHVRISYAVFCLKKKKNKQTNKQQTNKIKMECKNETKGRCTMQNTEAKAEENSADM